MKRIKFESNMDQVLFVPTFGLKAMETERYRYRIVFGWLWLYMSIGIKKEATDANER